MDCDRCGLGFEEDDLEYYEPLNEYLCDSCLQESLEEIAEEAR